MPKFLVHHEERVSYESVIVEAPDAEAAEEIVRNSDPRDFDPSCEDGDDYSVEAVEAKASGIRSHREAEVRDGAVVPFKKATHTIPACEHLASGAEMVAFMCAETSCNFVSCSGSCRDEHDKETGHV